MKKLQCALLAGLMACSLCACGQDKNNGNNNQSNQSDNLSNSSNNDQKSAVSYHTPEAIKNRGELVVGVRSGSYEFFKNKDGAESGYEVDLSNAIAKDIGDNVKVKYVESTVENMLDSLAAGEIDIALASLESNAELKEKFTLSKSYWPWEAATLSVFVLNSNKEKYTKLEEISKSKVAVTDGTLHADIVEAYAPEVEKVNCKDVNECVEKLMKGEVEAIVAEDADLAEILSNKPEIIKSNITIPENPEDQGLFIAMMKNNTELQQLINKTVTTNRENGELENWIFKAWTDSMELNSKNEKSEPTDEANEEGKKEN